MVGVPVTKSCADLSDQKLISASMTQVINFNMLFYIRAEIFNIKIILYWKLN